MRQPFQRPIFLLTDSEELEANLRRVLERPFALHRVANWVELKASLSAASQTAVCFADAMTRVGPEMGLAEGLREIASDFPLVAVVACLRGTTVNADVFLALQAWHVAEVLDLDREQSAAALARRLDEVKDLWAQRLLKRALPRTLSARGRALVDLVASVAAEGGLVPELAGALGVDRRTVPRWCAAAGVPDARRMFSWIRLLLAAELLDDPRRAVENVARVSGFSSAGSLKSSTRTFTGLTPTELRERGAFETVAGLARSEFREARDVARRSKRHANSWYN